MICRKCGIDKPNDQYYAYGKDCKVCRIDAARKWKARHPGYAKARYKPVYSHAWNLRRKYNMTLEEFNTRLEKQNNECRICAKPIVADGTKRLHVDHVEIDGKPVVRALLCPECNKGIGLFYHHPSLLKAAAAYLEAFSG